MIVLLSQGSIRQYVMINRIVVLLVYRRVLGY